MYLPVMGMTFWDRITATIDFLAAREHAHDPFIDLVNCFVNSSQDCPALNVGWICIALLNVAIHMLDQTI